ncbi:MAG: imidazole glycerol phosphate synthase subunit HisH [Bacteroidota bacterium]
MVTIIDYGIGNLRSIEKAFEAVGAEVRRTDDPAHLAEATHLVLPGVGAFGACADEIRRRNLEAPIRAYVATGRPFLGVCVGMQLLFDASNERGHHEGLRLLPGRVVRFATQGVLTSAGEAVPAETMAAEKPLKVPHMGWNTVHFREPSPLIEGLPDEAYFYFVHSYHVVPTTPTDVLGATDYGGSFPAIVARNNVYGVQFHPEKSQTNGLRILRNFAALSVA